MVDVKQRTIELLSMERTNEVVDEIIRINHKLIYKQLHRFHLAHDPEAESIGFEALMNAAYTFNSDKPAKFPTYATVCIYNRLSGHIKSLNTIRMQEYKAILSLDKPVKLDGSTLGEFIAGGIEPEMVLNTEDRADFIMRKVWECYETFSNSPKRKLIVKTWIDSNFEMVHTDIAKVAKCTQTYVSQTIQIFKFKLGGLIK